MTFEQFKEKATQAPPPSIRKGQFALNMLETIRPDISHRIVATVYDPFYDDSKLESFWTKVQSLWQSNCGSAC